MKLAPYRQLLAVPGFRALLLISMLARIPATTTGVVLTLYVVFDLGRGYGAAGLVGAAMTIGMALGAPLLGRLVDRHGLRPVLSLTGAASAAFWAVTPALSYPLLLVAAFLGGLLTLPAFSVIRQAIAAMVPEQQRRPAFALDAMSVELSFMIGPALAVLMTTTVSARATLYAVGASIVAAGLALYLFNPPTRAVGERGGAGASAPLRSWFSAKLAGVLVAGAAATVALGGTDVAVVAVLRASDQVAWTGVTLAAWAAFSMVGGFVYGTITRPLSPLLLVTALSVCTIPVGLGGGQWWLLCLALIPAGLLCAPTLAATADAVSRLTPPQVRGAAMGLHGSALTVGMSLGAPLAGAVIDATSPAWGFAATGLVGLLATTLALPTLLRRRRDTDPATPLRNEPAGAATGAGDAATGAGAVKATDDLVARTG